MHKRIITLPLLGALLAQAAPELPAPAKGRLPMADALGQWPAHFRRPRQQVLHFGVDGPDIGLCGL